MLEADRYRVSPRLRYDFEVDRFELAARAALRDHASVEQLRAALEPYRGDLLEVRLQVTGTRSRNEQVTKLLRDVLMAEPEPETSALHDRIRSAQPSRPGAV